jgi:cell division septation protein DedD
VRMRAALPFLLAAVLGVSSAALVACGSGGGDRSDLIPQRSASRLKSALSDVQSAVDQGNCDAAERAVARARGVLVNLPRAVDDRLVARLRDGLDNLQQIAPDECRQQDTTSTQTTTQTTTPTATTPTDTTPTDTTPTDTTPTDTTPTDTTPTTTGTTTTPPPTTTAPPAGGDTTGGTTTP